MKVLLLGGSGILSTDFTRKLLNEGNDVWILNRGKRTAFIDHRAKLIVADLRNESVGQLKAKLADYSFNVVVDFLAFEPKQVEKALEILNGKFNQYILISSATAYIKNDGDVIREDTHEVGNKDWSYSYKKSLCENYIKGTDITYTIIRPYVTYGESRLPFQLIPDGYHYTLIQRIINDKPVALLNGGSAVCTLTNTVDFANVLYGLLLNDKAYGQTFHITSSYQQTWKKVYETYCEILGHKPKLVSVSLDDIQKYLPEYYETLKGDKGTSWRFDNTKVLNAVGGYDFCIDLKTGLRKSVDYFKSHEEMQGIDYKWEGKMDYMISHVSKYKGMKPLISNNQNSNNKNEYYILRTPILHEAYMLLWRIKHRK